LVSLKNIISPNPLHAIQMGWFILLELLLIFDTEFSKFHLFGQFYLYDVALFLLVLWSIFYIIRDKKFWIEKPLLLILLISIAYLGYSFLTPNRPVNYTIRQFAPFIYLGCAYLLSASFLDKRSVQNNVRFIMLMGLSALIIQVGYHVYLFFRLEDYQLFGHFYYFSKMGILAVIVSGAFVITFIKNPWKWPVAIFYMILCISLGHASAFLAAFSIIFIYIILNINRYLKIIILGLYLGAMVLLLIYVPAFSDRNTMWRLIFWQFALEDIVINYYGILGHGFGVRYTTPEILEALREISSPWFEVRPEEQFTSPHHNSFLTMAFHIGILPSFLVFLPLKNTFRYFLFHRKRKHDLNADFLLLTLVGAIVWASFNVILELPHSSGFFWLIYFTTLYYFKQLDKDNKH